MARKYSPRRASLKRWLQDAPVYILDCFDNKGKTADRYTVVFNFPEGNGSYAGTWLHYLGMSGAPTYPQGFSQFGEMSAYEMAQYRYRVKHQRVRWLDLPEHIRNHVKARWEAA